MSNLLTPRFFPMYNVIQNYAWGSKTSIHDLFGIDNSDNEPQAEIWMGAHPNGCSKVTSNDNQVLLSQLIDTDQAAFLSSETAEKFGQLPYLFKVLAAASALSIQVHPSKELAEQGFKKEEQQGIPLKAAHRNYKDPNHKPELVFALTDYQAMNGFRNFDSIISLFKQVNVEALSLLVNEFASNVTSEGLQSFFTQLLSLTGDTKTIAVEQLIRYAKDHEGSPLFSLILKLEKQYAGDIGLFAPLMLNVVTLKPGEAMYLDALTPHAYIEGTGLEIMANSDNVLRAGLTPKHMDIDELVHCTLFQEKPANTLLLKPEEKDGALNYPIPVSDFNFSVYNQSEDRQIEVHSAEILLPIDEALVVSHESGESVTIEKGHSVFIPAYVKSYTLNCNGRVARAYN